LKDNRDLLVTIHSLNLKNLEIVFNTEEKEGINEKLRL
jgi:hypothetical protein